MKKTISKSFLSALTAAVFLWGCQKNVETPPAISDEAATSEMAAEQNRPKQLKDFVQVNLVGDNNEFNPQHIDAGLINAWGIAFPASGPAWVSSMFGGLAKVFFNDGTGFRVSVFIPSPNAATGGHPTGVVFNSTTDFKLRNGNPARFIYAQADGLVSGWNGGETTVKMIEAPGELYTGIALASDGGNNFLYVANFSAGKIEVFDKTFTEVSKPFKDPYLPPGFSPYNIQNIDGKLYVTYAQNGTKPGEVVSTGRGKGFINIFNPDGSFVKRFASAGKLNAPWGVTKAPQGFWGDGADLKDIILIGNFGDGRINAYRSDGKFEGQLRAHGKVIEIEGLWGLAFPPSNSTVFNPNHLFFSAGPGGEQHGLFGFIKK